MGKNLEKISLEEILKKKGLLEEEKILENILKNEKLLSISKIILLFLLGAGLFTLAVAAPGLPRALSLFFPKKKYKKENFQKIQNQIYILKHRKLINIAPSKDGLVIKLTERGREKALKCYLKAFALKYKKWDKKWRLVVFDIPTIPTKLNLKRDALRSFLTNMGFKIYQKSIYIFPYPCREEIEAFLEYLQLKPYVRLFEATFIEDEEKFKKRFKV